MRFHFKNLIAEKIHPGIDLKSNRGHLQARGEGCRWEFGAMLAAGTDLELI